MTGAEAISFLAVWVLIMFPLVILASWLLSMPKVEAVFVGIFEWLASKLQDLYEVVRDSWRETKQRWGK